MNSTASQLLTALPAELRNEIWRLVLILPHRVWLNTHANVIHQQTALLKTSRQIRAEASSIFYGENKFHTSFALGREDHLVPWLSAIGRDNARLIHLCAIHFTLSAVTASLNPRESEFYPMAKAYDDYVDLVGSTAAGVARSMVEHGMLASCIGIDQKMHSGKASPVERRLFVVKMRKYFKREVRPLREEEKDQRG